MAETHGATAFEGGIGGFLLGALVNGGGNGLFGNNGGANGSTALLQSDLNNLSNQINGVNQNIQNTANNALNQSQHSAILGAIANNGKDAMVQGYQNTITSLQGQFAIEKSISDLGTQMQLGFKDTQLQTALGFKDAQLQSAMQTCDIKDTVNAGFTRQLESDLAEARARLHMHEFVVPIQSQVANINVNSSSTP